MKFQEISAAYARCMQPQEEDFEEFDVSNIFTADLFDGFDMSRHPIFSM
jgi:hypothetical protein